MYDSALDPSGLIYERVYRFYEIYVYFMILNLK